MLPRLVIDALEAHWADFEKKGVTDVGILIDWCGLYQAPRTEEQTPIFAEALKAINQARRERPHTTPALSAPLSPANRLVRSGMRTKAPPCGASRPAKAPMASATMTRVGRRSSTGSR